MWTKEKRLPNQALPTWFTKEKSSGLYSFPMTRIILSLMLGTQNTYHVSMEKRSEP